MAWSTPRTWVTGETVTAAHMNQEVRDNWNAALPDGVTGASWSPTLRAATSNPTTSAVAGVEYQIGAIQFVYVRFVLSGGGSGDYLVDLPVASSGLTASTAAGKAQRIGGFIIRDDSPPHMIEGAVVLYDSDTVWFNANSTEGAGGGVLSHDNPRNWASGDVLSFEAHYPFA